MSADDDENPSTNISDKWIWARGANVSDKPSNNTKTGKWMIFVKPGQIDELWQKIKKSVEEGKLGESAKVSTIVTFYPPDFLICVYTKNWEDKDDVFQHRAVLTQLGVTWKIYYKSDELTLAEKATGKKAEGKRSIYSA